MESVATPQNVVVVLLDSLNRHMLGSYGSTEFETPNLDRFATTRATRFTRHVTGSLPCMPARHDILCGTLDFLWRPWGSIELWDEPITAKLRQSGVTTMLVSDHPHLFETGGENYQCDFAGWEYVRGHESDHWRTHTDPSFIGSPETAAGTGDWFFSRAFGFPKGSLTRGYDRSRTFFREESDYPGPRTMRAAAEWIAQATPQHDRWMLFVDEFDPHEPFDTPAPWRGKYDAEPWDEAAIIWPPYTNGGISKGLITEAEGRHIRANYGSKLSMIDHWFGEIVASLTERGLWDTTAVIVCTDHGHYFGEVRDGHDIWGKPGVPQFEPLGHTPLLIHWPGVTGGGTCDALDDQHRPVRDPRRRVRSDERAAGPRHVAGAVARRNRDIGARLGDRWRVGQLGADHRRRCANTLGPPRAPTTRYRCGRIAGRRCRCPSSGWSGCRPPIDGRRWTSCPAARSR